MIPLRTAVLMLCLAALPGRASAQAAQPPEPPPRFEGSAGFAFLQTTGNADSRSIGSEGHMTWHPDPWIYSVKAAFAQVKDNGTVSAKSITALARAARKLSERMTIFGQYDYLQDEFAGVNDRNIVEIGASYLAVSRAPHRLRLDAGLGYLDERGREESFASTVLDLAAACKLTISEATEILYEPRFLLPFRDGSAWRFDQLAALTTALNSFLSLKVSHTVRYSHQPPEGFDTTDTIMGVSLVAKIKRRQ
jgi:putative salt-induced outer membrane protein YdiY